MEKKRQKDIQNQVLREIIAEIEEEQRRRASFPHWSNWYNWGNWGNWYNWNDWGNWINW